MVSISIDIKSIVHIILFSATSVIFCHVAFTREKLVPISSVHYFLHWLYGKYEPQVLRIVDWVFRRKFIYGTRAGRALARFIATLSHYFPHGIIVTTRSAVNLVHYIEKLKSSEDGPRLAVGHCVCQMSLDKWEEPSCKDIVVLYGADIYLHLKRGYRIIDAAEAEKILNRCRDSGLVHSLDFCMQSGKWHFVICNCDRDICVITRAYFLTGKMLYPGPVKAAWDDTRCRGAEKCGKCVDACMFGANYIVDNTLYFDEKKCLGCGQCARVCPGKARSSVEREKYRYDRIIPAEILLR